MRYNDTSAANRNVRLRYKFLIRVMSTNKNIIFLFTKLPDAVTVHLIINQSMEYYKL